MAKNHYEIVVDYNNIYNNNENLKKYSNLIVDDLNAIVDSIRKFADFDENDNIATNTANDLAQQTIKFNNSLENYSNKLYDAVTKKLEDVDLTNKEFEQKFVDLIEKFDGLYDFSQIN